MAITNHDNKYKVEVSNKQILRIALPISLAILVPQINFITNNIFLGHYGEKFLAIAGITGVYYLIFAVVGNGLNNGLQVLIARRAGENRIDEIGNLFSQGVRISFVWRRHWNFSNVSYCSIHFKIFIEFRCIKRTSCAIFENKNLGIAHFYIYIKCAMRCLLVPTKVNF